MLNTIWFSFFAIAFFSGLYQWLASGDAVIWAQLVEATFIMAKTGFELSIGLVGILSFWLGLFAVAKEAGLVQIIARGLAPLFKRLMPDIPCNHPALASITMNMAANMLGLDNAATPLGLQAMKELQTLNPSQDTATNAQILFLVLNASSLTLLPVTIFMYRAQLGAADPASVFIPILLATAIAKLVGITTVCIVQRLPVWDRVVFAYFVGFTLFVGLVVASVLSLASADQTAVSSLAGNLLIFSIIVGFLFAGWRKKLPVYEIFISGAKEGFGMAVGVIPYLVAMMVAIGVFRASGALDGVLWVIERTIHGFGFDAEFVKALPTALMKPFSGSGARAMMLETMQHYGVDSFPGRLAAIIQGSTETTFYVLAVYFGAVGITKTRHAIACGLLAECAGIVAAIMMGYVFFGYSHST